MLPDQKCTPGLVNIGLFEESDDDLAVIPVISL